MTISEIRFQLLNRDPQYFEGQQLLAFSTFVFEHSLVLRDVRIIQGTNGPFIAMPSRILTDRCTEPKCRAKNYLRSRFCHMCGKKLEENRIPRDDFGEPIVKKNGRVLYHQDIVHPCHQQARIGLEEIVIGKYFEEVESSMQPGYNPNYDPPDAMKDIDHFQALDPSMVS